MLSCALYAVDVTGEVQVRYPHRDMLLLIRVVLCLIVALAWLGMVRELVKWGRGNATIQRVYLKWLKRRARRAGATCGSI